MRPTRSLRPVWPSRSSRPFPPVWPALRLPQAALVLFSLVAATASPSPAQTPVRPPHALPALGLADALPTAAELARPFDTPLPVRLRSAADPSTRERAELVTCADWLARRHEVTGSDNDAAWRVVRLQAVPCEAMALLAAAQPAQHNALADEPGHRPLLTTRYPASLWPAPSDDERRRLALPGQSLARASGVMHWQTVVPPGMGVVNVGGDERLQLRSRRWQLTLTLLARGDFDHDGWDDAAYLWQAASQRGSFSDARLVVLTRRTGEPQLRELPVDALLQAAQNRK